ncbi:MAG: hypothetical protein RLZZ77_1805 [Bacteroidota bacterium]
MNTFLLTMKSYSALLEQLDQTPRQIAELTQSLSREQWRSAPNGKWSIAIHVGHLLTIESLWIGRMDNFVLGHDTLRAWNGTNQDTLDGRFNEQNPKGILEDFESIRTAHVQLMRKYEGRAGELSAMHPSTGKQMTLHEHAFTMLEHDYQHIEYIKGLLPPTS